MATSLPTYTGDFTSLVAPHPVATVDALIVGSKWGPAPAGNGVELSFSFPAQLAAFDTRPNVPGNYNVGDPNPFSNYLAGFSAFTAAQQLGARQVLQTWANVANLAFNEVVADGTSAGVLRFANSAPPGLGATTWGVSWFPQDYAGAGDTWMNSAFLFPEGWAAGTQNFLTLLHEVGHALGLKHPHDSGLRGEPGWPASPVVLPFTGTDTLTSESTQTMVMAYNDIPGRSTVGDLALQSDFAPTTPMRWDIAAIQYLYGPNMAFNAGDTVYTFDGNARYNQTLWDAGGNDTLVATGSRAVEIDLRGGQWSKLGQPVTFSTRDAVNAVVAAQPQFDDPYTVFIYDTVVIENATGSDGDDGLIGNEVANRLLGGGGNDTLLGLGGADILFGGAGDDDLRGGDAPAARRDDTLRGGAGNDILLGGEGNDTAEWAATRASFSITRSTSSTGVDTLTVVDNTGANGSDTLVGVERLIFSDKLVAFGERAEQVARVAFVLWTPDIVASGSLFARGLSFYDVGYDFNFMAQVALQFWPQQGADFAQILVNGARGTNKTVADVLALMNAAGPGDVGRAAAVAAMAMDPATTQQLTTMGVVSNGVVADLSVPGFGTLFALLPG